MTEKFLIVGLGNPDLKYKDTRHNVGFMFIDFLSSKYKITLSEKKFNGIFAKIKLENFEFFLAKPLTYMNLSGSFIMNMVNFNNIKKENILVVYDDVDLKFGNFKFKQSGSSGGHNGMKDIINKIGSEEIKRLKIGIGKPENIQMGMANYVLSKFSLDEKMNVNEIFFKLTNLIDDISKMNFLNIMNKYNIK